MNRKDAEAVIVNKFKFRRISDIYVPQDDADVGNNDNGGNKDLCQSKSVIFIN